MIALFLERFQNINSKSHQNIANVSKFILWVLSVKCDKTFLSIFFANKVVLFCFTFICRTSYKNLLKLMYILPWSRAHLAVNILFKSMFYPTHVLLCDGTVTRRCWPLTTASGRPCFGHKSPAARARELFKPSTDLASLLLNIAKKQFSVSVGGFLKVTSQRGHVLEFLAGPGPRPIDPFFWLKVLLKTRSKSASIEPLIDLLAHL